MRRNGFGPARIRYAFAVAIAAYAVVGVFSITGHAGQARQVTAAGSYSAAQANRGKTLYSDQCVACHGEMLEGVVGPPLTGDDFLTDFGGHPVLLDRSVWPLADRLRGDAGFGALRPPGSAGVALIDVAGRNPDVDTPADLDTLQGSSS